MATVEATITATPAAVFAVLADGWTYAGWVVGTSYIRAVAAEWPAVGSTLHHTSGSWPLTVQDETRVEESDPGRRLVLVVGAGELGSARVDLSLVPDLLDGRTTRVTMVEQPMSGPARWFHTSLADAVLRQRNAETLIRLARLVERPTTPTR